MGEETKYLVHVDADTAILAVVGKAGYMNCRNVAEFFSATIDGGCKNLLIQCRQCTGMDSTFLGMITSAVLKLRKIGGTLTLLNLSERNQELIENLGLAKLVKTASFDTTTSHETTLETTVAKSSEILSAHESLIEADSANLSKFQDVIAFLKKDNQ
jgi:anti-anti-sigma factor